MCSIRLSGCCKTSGSCILVLLILVGCGPDSSQITPPPGGDSSGLKKAEPVVSPANETGNRGGWADEPGWDSSSDGVFRITEADQEFVELDYLEKDVFRTVDENTTYQLVGKCFSDPMSGSEDALVQLEFLDQQEEPISSSTTLAVYSESMETYYLYLPTNPHGRLFMHLIRTPPGTQKLRLAFRKWSNQEEMKLSVTNEWELKFVKSDDSAGSGTTRGRVKSAE